MSKSKRKKYKEIEDKNVFERFAAIPFSVSPYDGKKIRWQRKWWIRESYHCLRSCENIEQIKSVNLNAIVGVFFNDLSKSHRFHVLEEFLVPFSSKTL